MEPATEFPLVTYAVGSLMLLLITHGLYVAHTLRHIPTVGGPSLPFLSFIGAFKYIFHTRSLFQEGYDKHKGSVFKIALLDRWLILVTGPKLVDELQRAPDDHVSLMEAIGELLGMTYVFGREVIEDPYNGAVTRERLNRNLGVLYGDVYDEISNAFCTLIPATKDEWLAVRGLKTLREIVARATNRAFVGRPLCREAGFLDISTDLAHHAAKVIAIISVSPPMLKPLAGKLSADFNSRVKRAKTFLDPVILERLKYLEADSDGSEKPNDMLQWLVEGALSRGKSMDSVVRYLLSTNFVAIDTSSNTLTHAVYHLAAQPEFADILREEVRSIIEEHGWTKDAVSKMHTVDSFLRESSRHNGTGHIVLMRKVLKDLHLSNGITVPAGNMVAVPASAIQHDKELLPDADTFDPWRFSKMQEENNATTKYQMVNPSDTYLAFGAGKHACPGRFFAANNLKTMLAYIVMNYDVKLEKERIRPPNLEIALAVVPNISAKVLFRRRK